MLSANMGKKLNIYVKDYVVFDLETTGTSCTGDEVVEISAIKVQDGRVVEEFSTLVNPQIPIPFWATDVNGITDKMVANAPTFDKALADFLTFVGDMVLVGHNIHTFDMKFICRDAVKYFGKTIGNDYIDTLPLARIYLPQLGHHTLTGLARYYGISISGAHRALNDCRMNQQIFERLAEEMKNPSEEAKKVKKCPRCGSPLKLRSGKFGKFWGCTSYPNCRYTKDAEENSIYEE
ncbi:MAG: topoisomerase DNA-binding C4 zinc finger domain-containing protein [Lachnospiraceae bacterium]|nr:topoisomerase DNA-binding C4 zinc finger domain-containing protein [Lachnospiraceae bacterium]